MKSAAIEGARRPGAIGRALRRKIPLRLRDPLRWRQGTGMVLFAYATTHLLNHALGNISLDAMFFGASVKRLIWDNLVGTALLYGSLVLHVILALQTLAKRHNWRMPTTQALQIATGLTIPVLLFPHIVATRGAEILFSERVGYSRLLAQIWPTGAVLQTLLLAFVWIHGCLGMRQWLQTKPFYQKAAPGFAAAATAILVFAFTGFVSSGRMVAGAATPPDALPEAVLAAAQVTRTGVYAALAILASLYVLKPVLRRRRRRIVILYDNGDAERRAVVARKGESILDASRGADIPHASACNGRARCSTCRVLVLKGHDSERDQPGAAEGALLKKIKAPPNVRLACQYKPSGNVTVRRLVGAGEIYDASTLDDPYRFGVEREVVALFADLRGFTGISERWLPYDVVHLLNAYFDRVTRRIEANGGEIDKFMGDGVMALFSRKRQMERSARQALAAALDILKTVEAMNAENTDEWEVPLRVAIGIHGGLAILGQIGGGNHGQTSRTALGRTINAASRLQDFAKTKEAALAVSADIVRLAGLAEDAGGERVVAELRGSTRALDVVVFADSASLERALESAGEKSLITTG
ncbi:adenylate/guanylate cyclase domain-containing protein [Jiella mangrovi]|uniref:Adenylate/guanylate cyclase domain-containing protein n=1 Tax=Jiella mangrovi TaxID=2821407 RepID=A0ABS4BI26_9HYPH|nr:adenylate/guanylate cyclase domain-containing protein [Jiella mangrovi]MBP0615605.1 adenylate/guanylate cyclase domain-containing protein [Jiella mangrovi]